MVYIENWDDFQERSIVLFRSDPVATRYVMKYRHCDGKLVLKVTDDRVCLKFKTDQAQDLRKMEKLNNTFFSMMARGPDEVVPEDLPKEPVVQQPSKKGRGRRQWPSPRISCLNDFCVSLIVRQTIFVFPSILGECSPINPSVHRGNTLGSCLLLP